MLKEVIINYMIILLGTHLVSALQNTEVKAS